MSKTAMKLALKAFEVATTPLARDRQEVLRAQAALREALAEQKSGIKQVIELYDSPDQPSQQEPVAWKDEQGNVRMTLDSGEIQSPVGYVYSVHGERIKNACIRSDIPNGTPLYTSPPAQRKPLTDEEIVQIELGLRQYNNRDTYDLSLKDFARAIEAKLKEKNT